MEARSKDIEDLGENSADEDYIGDRELEVAYEEYPLIEGLGLVGLFSLVYMTSQLQSFLQEVLEACGWSIAKKRGFPWREYLATIEEHAQFTFDEQKTLVEFLREMILARNDFVHNDGSVSGDYLREIASPRFVRDGAVAFDLDDVENAVRTFEEFADFVVSKCVPFSKGIV